MEIIIIVAIVAIVAIAIIFFVNQSNEKRRKIEQESERQERLKYYAELTRQQDEVKRNALIQEKKLEKKKKLNEANRLKKVRLKKIEEEKYKTFSIVKVEERNNLGWISETQHNIKEKENNEQKEKEEKIAKQNAPKSAENFYEINTEYFKNIKSLHYQNTITFNNIRRLSVDYVNQLSGEIANKLHSELNSGVTILETEAHLHKYMHSFGNMHQAKLIQSLEAIPELQTLINNKDIQINDYGCGQGIGSIVFIDYLKSIQATNFTISNIKLFEPSQIAIKRATLNIKYCLKSIYQNENVLSISKKLDDLTTNDITTNLQAIKFHIFSNIIDVESFNIQLICAKIAETQKGINYFICVSPNIMQSRNKRLDEFMNYFQQRHNVSVISTRESKINNWTRYERVFKVNFLKSFAIATMPNPELLAYL